MFELLDFSFLHYSTCIKTNVLLHKIGVSAHQYEKGTLRGVLPCFFQPAPQILEGLFTS